VTGIELFPTRLSELSVPKALVTVNYESKGFKFRYNRIYVFYGNDNIITVDAYPSIERFNIFLGKGSVERILNS